MKKSIEIKYSNKNTYIDTIKLEYEENRVNSHRKDIYKEKNRIKNTQSN